MQYRLRTLILVTAVAPIAIGAVAWLLTPPDPNIPRTPESKQATAEIRRLLRSADALEILEAGDAMSLKAKTFQGESLQRLADAATIVDVETGVETYTVVENAYFRFRLVKDNAVLREFCFHYPDSLDEVAQDDSKVNLTGWIMSPKFVEAFLSELTTR